MNFISRVYLLAMIFILFMFSVFSDLKNDFCWKAFFLFTDNICPRLKIDTVSFTDLYLGSEMIIFELVCSELHFLRQLGL